MEKKHQNTPDTDCANPVLSGEFADPDIALFGDTYYLYATTDGYPGWSGTKFHVFSSKNLVDFVDEGVILDVAGDDVTWAVGSAWAPCIAEKNGRYYFYFCAKDAAGDSHIGVAYADHPAGSFTAMNEPLITKKICIEHGIAMGQTIDPSVFTDEDGSYLLFGNGNAAVVRLNEDMVSLDLSTLVNYEGLFDFREAVTVTKREGRYHFTWSCDDTGSPDYHVNYGTAKSIYGPITYHYTLLKKDEENKILGTGHHCMLHIPDSDEYYIAYHRFYTPLGIFTNGFGFHREVCIDELHFDKKTGLMLPVVPTNKGVAPRTVKFKNAFESAKKELLADYEALTVRDMDAVRGNLYLATTGENGAKITWESSNPSVIMAREQRLKEDGARPLRVPAGVVTRGARDEKVELYAYLSMDGVVLRKDFSVTVLAKPEKPEYSAYLFSYFIGSRADQENVFFAVSEDGINWKATNKEQPVLKTMLGTTGIRDPFISRSAEGDRFFLIATDLCIAKDGDWVKAQRKGSQSIFIWESLDLIHWSEPRLVKINSDTAGCTWAPEAFYDERTGEYLVFWASRVSMDNFAKQRIYYVKTRDFYYFTEPQIWMDYPFSVIDTTIIQDGGVYYRFTKYEDRKRVMMERANSLMGEWSEVKSESLLAQEGVEGPCCFALHKKDQVGGNRFCLLLDHFVGSGYYMMMTKNLENAEFKREENYCLPQKRPHHGTVIPITEKEYKAVVAHYQ